jgi:predicted ATPase
VRRDDTPPPADPGPDIIDQLPPGPERDYFIEQRAGQQRALLMPKLPERHAKKVEEIPLPPELAAWDWTKGPLLWGAKGTGKTQAATTMVFNAVKSRRHQAKGFAWVSTSRLFADLRRRMDDKNLVVPDIENMRDATLVVLDDFGRERPSDWTEEQTFVFIDDLYNREVEVIVTTNMEPESLASRIGTYAHDRLMEITRPHFMDGLSYRRTK